MKFGKKHLKIGSVGHKKVGDPTMILLNSGSGYPSLRLQVGPARLNLWFSGLGLLTKILDLHLLQQEDFPEPIAESVTQRPRFQPSPVAPFSGVPPPEALLYLQLKLNYSQVTGDTLVSTKACFLLGFQAAIQ